MQQETKKRILLAAPKSGSGKTTITCGLMQALKSRGLEVTGFKCGPDYIDPMFHKMILGIDSRNLDSYFMKKDEIRSALYFCRTEYAVIEGVMGLYDGRDAGSTDGSAYEIASLTDTPIILVVDASGVGRTVISTIKGILLDDTQHLIRGIILNRITEGFYEKLHTVLEEEIASMRKDVRLLGFIPKKPEIIIGSRHLGLLLPEEIDDIRDKLTLTASLLESHMDMEALLTLMQEAGNHDTVAEKAKREVDRAKRELTLAVAYDDAFCFYYKENLELFQRLGVSIRYFSPLRDKALPEKADGILIGGGYPENHLEELSQNTSMLLSVKEAIEAGIPSLAECGGFMYLHKTIRDRAGSPYDMVGVIDAECFWAKQLIRFGYLEVLKANDPDEENKEKGSAKNSLTDQRKDHMTYHMTHLKGHEFHYYESSMPGNALTVAKPDHGKKWECVISEKNGIWGFPHFYYPSAPEFAVAFVNLMKQQKHSRCAV